ncbi:MAG TPA: hypothetical protein DD390_05460 [Rhodospirillaceae bacterium]|nr:hypothetical protein [Rhodospirillaceae bacterium]MBB56623.1 hypothetical protein [Rhodospirillaceae bacterium]HBM12122.1 hypothetical protein [Rhodospirillaceae bacterium]|tara:strand:+ start:131 stop:406 length:276 start_codon:yes stop_codon:yes gene_type:complete
MATSGAIAVALEVIRDQGAVCAVDIGSLFTNRDIDALQRRYSLSPDLKQAACQNRQKWPITISCFSHMPAVHVILMIGIDLVTSEIERDER